MKKASIVSIGDEILNGQTVDTNTAYLSSEMLSIGIPVVSLYTAGDDVDLIVRALELAGSDADIVLATGGLGPTDDDLTRQALAKFLGTELQFENELFQKIQDFFTRRNLKTPAKTKSQAYIPAGTKALANNLGTAPGIMAEVKGKLFIAVPGVPSEMKQMFKESVLAKLKELSGRQTIELRKLRCFGAGESDIAESLNSIMQRGRNPLINCTVSNGIITLYIIATAKTREQAQQMAEKDEELLRNILGDLVYGTGEQTLAKVVGKKLTQQRRTITVAESCTGGLIAKLLTDIPGASGYFTHGWVVYSNGAKTGELGVPADLIEKYGAVSKQVAEAMAQGAIKKAEANFAIGVSGIAGPSGGDEQKPVGLVYISVCSDNNCRTRRFVFPNDNDRDIIRIRAAQTALNMLRLEL